MSEKSSRIPWVYHGTHALIPDGEHVYAVDVRYPFEVVIKKFVRATGEAATEKKYDYHWRGRLSSNEQGQNIARRWLRRNGVIAESVGRAPKAAKKAQGDGR